jgi:hypothetical protein
VLDEHGRRDSLVGRRVSDTVPQVVPADPDFVPATAAAEAALALLLEIVGPEVRHGYTRRMTTR